jgi:Mlc titration factor MtfA (ptsG expression regulator)
MFQWFKKRRRKKILLDPFPKKWRQILSEKIAHFSYLSSEERVRLEQFVQIFIAEKDFEGCNGQIITDEIKVVIASQACLLILNLPHDFYAKVNSILVYPSTVVLPKSRTGVFTRGPLIARTDTPIVGQAFMHGTVILVWDVIKREAAHPRGGHNVVYHEFAHILDMFDGKADGTPLLRDREQYREWAEVCTRVFYDLRKKMEKGRKTFLNNYAATNEAEFFAVATEYFFDRPVRMQKKRPELYEVLKGFYRQDTALRLKDGVKAQVGR